MVFVAMVLPVVALAGWTKTFDDGASELLCDVALAKKGCFAVGWSHDETDTWRLFVLRLDDDCERVWWNYFALDASRWPLPPSRRLDLPDELSLRITPLCASPCGRGCVVFGIGVTPDESERIVYFKVKDNGGMEWARSFAPDSLERTGFSIKAVESALAISGGFVLVVGCVQRGDIGERAFAAKLDPTGEVIWYREYGDGPGDFGFSSAAEADDGYLFVGYAAPEDLEQRAWLVRTDRDGNPVLARAYDLGGQSAANHIWRALHGSYYIAGQVEGDTTGAFVMRTSSTGLPLWRRFIQYTDDELSIPFIEAGATQAGDLVILTYLCPLLGLSLIAPGVRARAFAIARISPWGEFKWRQTLEREYSPALTDHKLVPTKGGGFLVVGSEFAKLSELFDEMDVVALSFDSLGRCAALDVQPNPFDDVVFLTAQMPDPFGGYIDVRDVRGKRVAHFNVFVAGGAKTVGWKANDIPDGVYIATLRTESGFREAVKLLKLAR